MKRKSELRVDICMNVLEYITEMQKEYKLVGESVKDLEAQIAVFQRVGQTTEGRSLPNIFQDIEEYHDYVERLVQTRLYKLAGFPDTSPELSPGKVASGFLEKVGLASWWRKLTHFVRPSQEQDQELLIRASELPEDPVNIVLSHIKSDRIMRLNTILHGLEFPHGIETTTACLNLRGIVEMKISFEKYVFETIRFMYRYELIDQGHLKSLFSSPETLKLTGVHIYDLFQSHLGQFRDYHTFIPDMRFICNHWRTEHLHSTLSGNKIKFIHPS